MAHVTAELKGGTVATISARQFVWSADEPEAAGGADTGRHPNKSRKWLVKKYWCTPGRKWVFSTTASTKRGVRRYVVQRLSSIGIRRHIKVIADANPYMPEFGGYFYRRRKDRDSRLFPALSAGAYRAFALNRGETTGALPKSVLLECLSRMTGNCHVRF